MNPNATGEVTACSSAHRYGLFFVYVGRLLLASAFLSLCSAWITELTDRPLLGMNQQHLFDDSMALSLLAIGMLLDGLLHAKGPQGSEGESSRAGAGR